MSNALRSNLIMKFHCASCGNTLNLSYPKEGLELKSKSFSYGEKEPTGAMVCYNTQLIEPCGGCIDKLRGPAERFSKALREVIDQS